MYKMAHVKVGGKNSNPVVATSLACHTFLLSIFPVYARSNGTTKLP